MARAIIWSDYDRPGRETRVHLNNGEKSKIPWYLFDSLVHWGVVDTGPAFDWLHRQEVTHQFGGPHLSSQTLINNRFCLRLLLK